MNSVNPSVWALLVIDMQRDFCAPGGYADQAGLDIDRLRKPVSKIAELTAAARALGMQIIYTREGHRADLSDCTPAKLARSHAAGAPIGQSGPMGRLLIRGEYGHGVIDELAPQAGDIVVDKPGYGAFHHTDLDLLLSNLRIRWLVLTGVTTDVCVHSTLREAVDRGYRCVTVADTCAAGDPDLHAAALSMIRAEGGIFGEISDTAAMLRLWREAMIFSQ